MHLCALKRVKKLQPRHEVGHGTPLYQLNENTQTIILARAARARTERIGYVATYRQPRKT